MSQKRILVVDDEKEILDLVPLMLKHTGYEVVSAGDTMDALRLLDSQRFDLVLSDIRVSTAGRDFIYVYAGRKIRPPVIVMSGLYSLSDAELRKLQITAFLQKPFTKDALLQAIKQVLPQTIV
jgi:DNA-binding NtrC family response regulator